MTLRCDTIIRGGTLFGAGTQQRPVGEAGFAGVLLFDPAAVRDRATLRGR